MACITALQENAETGTWAGFAIKQGESKTFTTLDDYKAYTRALENKGTYCPDVEPQYATKYNKVPSNQESGFMQFRPRDPATQNKYDAMSPAWEGVASSDAAIARGDYSLDSAEANRDSLRKNPQPKMYMPGEGGPMPEPASSYCVVQ
jgi:hypothetical protein